MLGVRPVRRTLALGVCYLVVVASQAQRAQSTFITASPSHRSRQNVFATADSALQAVWDVYVDQSKTKVRGDNKMSPPRVMETIEMLSPSPDLCRVYPFAEGKRKGQSVVRCVQRDQDNDSVLSAFEVTVNTLDGIYRLMSHHMGLSDIEKIYDVLKNIEEGDRKVAEDESNAANEAIECYTRVLKSIDRNSMLESKVSRGLILTKRSQAFLRRAAYHQKELQALVQDLTETIPSETTIKIIFQTASSYPSLKPSLFSKLSGDAKEQQAKFRSIRFRHDMYEFALLHAVQDSLQSTQLLPENSKAFRIAGECLASLRKMGEAALYFRRALALLPPHDEDILGLVDVLQKNQMKQELAERARLSGFSGDTLRLALDVAAA
mmetsp:Transcript_30346/g.72201  ORF Transcript_30346/g.72201 Transcript_30346/m.72201 type:complete len:379 (-) Transcript_30346:124-1260(-)